MSRLKGLYHQYVPARVRFPLGRARRTLIDMGIRLVGRHGPLPPRRVLQKVQLTPWAMEYLEVGARCAATVRRELVAAGVDPAQPHRVLDFGCGLGRTLRHFADSAWEMVGCDVDAASIAWTRRALPALRLEVSPSAPPLPFDAGAFDAVYAISVFSHFARHDQQRWAAELARVLRPGGVALVTTMGPWAFDSLPANAVPCDEVEGFWFCPAGDAFNESAAIHTQAGITHFFAPHFRPGPWQRGGLDGFQDLGIFFRRDDAEPAAVTP